MFKFLNRKKDKSSIHQNDGNSRREKAPSSPKEAYNNILSFADSVLKNTEEQKQTYKQFYSKGNQHPILDVVRLLGRNVQTKYLTSLLYHEDETSLPSLFPDTVYFETTTSLTTDGRKYFDLIKEVKTTKEIDLSKDLVLPWPWQRDRLINTICRIGEDRIWGTWKQGIHNHDVQLWLPLGICWVSGGNHSIASGILQGQGRLLPKETYDISELYEYIYTDGINYYRKV
ncbi:hypothetical protein M670_01013 [Schinkia azotoformans MEV2011]|uniref:Uncharacterized protein n=1 Tax=Schinkia azotoformans MEV2011 TaxID=1348973 RepID=A0A072NQN1_SCHAZ|nr:DUF6710 family protein [Schinkia azotoformans]KEF39989.1 hypothetical protein M670_01013 [Schinkia azotoformans MEV2011]MEC1697287.1 hypothetical protein [Schinkia azotoformans]MEC1724326.1 hypothetical protein [Schinkia azotoformans]MEC1771529.1 hypothetical protein [Schinkia azotoformans]MED4367668.1 hypothetical protein [Schinkia azotoformans]